MVVNARFAPLGHISDHEDSARHDSNVLWGSQWSENIMCEPARELVMNSAKPSSVVVTICLAEFGWILCRGLCGRTPHFPSNDNAAFEMSSMLCLACYPIKVQKKAEIEREGII